MTKLEKYPSYKNSGVEWLGDIPEHWEARRLGFYFMERREKVSDKIFKPLSVTKNGIMPQLESAAKTNDGDNRKKVCKGDFVINSRSDRKGSSGLSELNGSVSLINTVLEPIAINPHYSHYLLKSNLFQEEYYRNGKGIVADLWSTNYSEMKNIIISSPPLEEQEKIANYLDKKTAQIDEAISQKQKLIELLKERKQIVINDAVTKGVFGSGTFLNSCSARFRSKAVPPKESGAKAPPPEMIDSGIEWIGQIPKHWEIKKLKNICIVNSKTLDENTNKNLEIKYVDIGSVSFESGINKVESFLFSKAPSRARRIVKKNDTIISTVRTYLKAIDFIDEIKSDYIFSTGFAVLEPNKNLEPNFLTFLVKSNFFTNQVDVNSKGMSYPAINSTDLSNLIVLLPPKQEQLHIVEYIENQTTKIDKAIELEQNYIEKLKEYKATLIDSVVTGKVRVC